VLLRRVLAHWTTPTFGASFLVTVATEGLAVVLAVLAKVEGVSWPAEVAFVAMLVGIALYFVVLAGFDARQVGIGHGDHWVLGGAAAIAALAAARIEIAGVHQGPAGTIAWVAWAWAMACLVLLVAGELTRPRPRYDVRRWATAFPVGMSAAASFGLAAAEDVAFRRWFADVWVWVGVAVWIAVAYGAERRITSSVRGGPPNSQEEAPCHASTSTG
jgi:hypothetical protein